LDEHRGADWYLMHLLPVVGMWLLVGLAVGQGVWKDGASSAESLSGALISHALFFGVTSILTEFGSRPVLRRLARSARASDPSRLHLASAALLAGLVPLAVFGAWFLVLGLPTTAGWFAGAATAYWLAAASNGGGIVYAESVNKRRKALEDAVINGELGAP